MSRVEKNNLKKEEQHRQRRSFFEVALGRTGEHDNVAHRYQSVEVVDKASTGCRINMRELPHVLCGLGSLHGAQRADIFASSTVIVFAVVCTPNKTQLNRNNFEHDGWVVYTLLCNNRAKSSGGGCTQLSSKKTLFFSTPKEHLCHSVTLILRETLKTIGAA